MKLSVPRARWYRLAAMPIEFPRPGRCTRSSPAPVERRGPGGGVGEVAGTRRRSGEIRNSHVVEAEVSEETAQPSGPLRGEMSSLPQFADNNWYVNYLSERELSQQLPFSVLREQAGMSGVWAHGFEHVVEFGDGGVGG